MLTLAFWDDELSHAGPSASAKPRLPGKLRALPGVGCLILTGIDMNTVVIEKLRNFFLVRPSVELHNR